MVFTSLSIKNFRCFSDFTIEPLERVNLIAGENNSGKTALLEAVFLVSGGNNLSRWEQTNSDRGMASPRRAVPASTGRLYGSDPASAGFPFWRHFFRNLDSTQTILISAGQAHALQALQHRVQLRVLDEDSAQLPLFQEQETTPHQNFTMDDFLELAIELVYVDPFGEARTTRVGIDRPGRLRVRPAAVRSFFLPANDRSSPEEDAQQLGELVVSKRPYDILDGLRIIEPRLRRLAPVPTAEGSFIYADIGLGEMLDLRLMGDGLVHLTSILLHIASAAGGIVLIDEIENGLHHSIMHKVWRAIGAAARQFNTQVIATTHSYECIWAAHEVFAANGHYDFHLHRLDRVDDKIRAFTYDQETLASSVKADLEVR